MTAAEWAQRYLEGNHPARPITIRAYLRTVLLSDEMPYIDNIAQNVLGAIKDLQSIGTVCSVWAIDGKVAYVKAAAREIYMRHLQREADNFYESPTA